MNDTDGYEYEDPDFYECEFIGVCKNTKLCFKCFNHEFFKGPKKTTTRKKKVTVSFEELNKEDSWKVLEQDVANGLNNIPTQNEARRSRCSGALWFEKGDIVDSILMPECKERQGNDIKNGADKSMSIKRSWLEKAHKEATEGDRIMTLPFRFKGDSIIYNIMMFSDLQELVTFYKQSREEVSIKEAVIDGLKQEKINLIAENKKLKEKLKELGVEV